MKHHLFAAAALAAGLAVAGAGLAQPAGVRQACAADREKLCPDVKPGLMGRGIRACMKAHYADLSDSCKAAIVQMRHAHGAGANGDPDAGPAPQGQ